MSADEALEMNDEVRIKEEAELRREQAAQYCLEQQGKQQAGTKEPERHRVKACAWLTALDHQVEVATARGIAAYCLPPEEEMAAKVGSPTSWPQITISLDQGSDGSSAAHWLTRVARCNALILHDGSHRAWNDMQNSLKDVGMWTGVIMLLLTFNMEHGPWQDAKWRMELREAATTYKGIADPSPCDLFTSLYPAILQDMGESDRICEDGFERTVFESIPDACRSCRPASACAAGSASSTPRSRF